MLIAALSLAGCGQAGSPVAGKEKTKPAAMSGEIAPGGYVTDAGNILTTDQWASLTKALSAFAARTRHQMVVVTVPSLEGRDIDAFTLDLANRWGIGRKGVNDGVVILVAPNERRVRIEVGLGLERALPDIFCKQVIQREMTPSFREGDYFGGLSKGAGAIMKKIEAS